MKITQAILCVTLFNTVIHPSQPTNIQVVSRLMTRIQLSWSPPTSIIAYYQIEYSYIGPCPVPNDPSTKNISNSMINERLPRYNVTGLKAYSDYSFVITAVNNAGMNDSDPITASTISASMKYTHQSFTINPIQCL